MRSIWRTLPAPTLRAILLVCLADMLIAMSFGALAVGGGLPWWVPCLISLTVFAGASQFVFLGLVLGGGGLLAAGLAALLVNLRLVPLGYAVGDLLESRRTRFLGAHLITDESVAFALQSDPRHRQAVYWSSGVLLFALWNLGTLVGALGGRAIDDVGAFGLDAAFPAVLLALVMPSLRERRVAVAGLVGAAIAVATTPLLPAGVPVLLALSATVLTLGRRPERSRSR
ncbi:AzlC family ABC transporter permease [Mobilicoccus sp.]|uniref:AzlC family ABC transporter permease n=1 Tax=Mobilicoccus sp. TaxID=2034349 RepID=UPI0028987A2A|nr:AzlC family ABC transporter permease [Mobilicoccus sp.]